MLTQDEKEHCARLKVDSQVAVKLKEITDSPLLVGSREQLVERLWGIKPSFSTLTPASVTALTVQVAERPEAVLAQNGLRSCLKYLIHPNTFPGVLLDVRNTVVPLGYNTYVIDHLRWSQKCESNFLDVTPTVKQESVFVTSNAVSRYLIVAALTEDDCQFDFLKKYCAATRWIFCEFFDKFKEWDELYGFELVGTGPDRLDFLLKTVPKDVGQFWREVSTVCYTAVENEEKLMTAIKKRSLITLQAY